MLKKRNLTEKQRKYGEIWPGYAHTMIGLKRMYNLQNSIETVIKEEIEGELVETGVWRGSACIFMEAVLAAHGIQNRKVILANSFIGLPKPDVKQNPNDEGDKHFVYHYLAVSKAEVEKNFKKYGLLDDQAVFLEGWFCDTLPNVPIDDKLSISSLDGDMYSSTMDALENFNLKLSAGGGFYIIDDYAIYKCRASFTDYRTKYKIDAELKSIDQSSVYWRKV